MAPSPSSSLLLVSSPNHPIHHSPHDPLPPAWRPATDSSSISSARFSHLSEVILKTSNPIKMAAVQTLPSDVAKVAAEGNVKLFGKWTAHE
jgi:hypothetical protein